MKSFSTLFILLFICILGYSQKLTPLHVVTHHRATINTDPATGEKRFTQWGVFPKKSVSIRKIILHLTLGSPDSLPTAHWDYCDIISLKRLGGKNQPSQDYEIGRMLTPYGSMFGKGWQWQWDVDVTDFGMLMRDSVEVEYLHTGYEPPSVAWALTLDFEIITGPEVLKPMQITKLWKGKYKYGDTTNLVEKQVLPINFESLPVSNIHRLRIQHTGHGMDKPKGCSEFCSRWRDIFLDNHLIDHRNMWKDCGNNPLYPQGGTWLYDRAYWCPGDFQVPDIFDIPLKPGNHQLKLSMEPYKATENVQAVENITSYLIQYSAPKQKYDIAIETVIVPNNQQSYSRMNPACFNPKIRIRNLGQETLKTITIRYGTEGFSQKSYSWKGNLEFNGKEEITLPGEIDSKQGTNTFSVSLMNPNGKKDEWPEDNMLTTSFNSPFMLPQQMIVMLKTNNHPSDNEIFIKNRLGESVFLKRPEDLKANTVYKDTLNLKPGNYEFFLTDTAGDGLEFWAEPDNGYGFLRLLDLKGNLIYSFESDCGNGQFLGFKASADYKQDTTARYAISMFPRLTEDQMSLDIFSNKVSKMTVLITVDGKIFERHDYTNVKNGKFTYNIGYLPKGRYVVEVLMDEKSQFKGRVNKK